MYEPRHFAESRIDVLHGLIRSAPLATLVTQNTAGELQADPIPLLIEPGPTPAGTLRGHVARANPLWRDTRIETDVLVVFQGMQAYISPNWYPVKAEHGKVVPTWNYIVVQVRGRLRVIDDAAWLRTLVGRLTDRFEAPLATREAPAWGVADAPADYIDSMLRAVVGIEIDVASITGKWKMSQNRSAADQRGVAEGLQAAAARTGDAESAAMAAQIGSAG